MGRPVYPHELKDPDFSWLISSYTEKNPKCILVDRSLTPVVLICCNDEPASISELPSEVAIVENNSPTVK